MRKAQFLSACCLLLCSGLAAMAQKAVTPKSPKQNKLAAVEREVKEFYDSYAEDLRQHRREAIADRYDPRGVFILGNGRKRLETFETVRNVYLTKWTGPKSFEWKDISIEVLSPGAAVVMCRFEWRTSSGQLLTYSYTGLLIKHSGKWRIRAEDESRPPDR